MFAKKDKRGHNHRNRGGDSLGRQPHRVSSCHFTGHLQSAVSV